MANDAVVTTVILGGLLALAYPLGMWLLDRLAHPARLKLADAANRLLNSPDLGPDDRRFVENLAARAFSVTAMPMVAVMLPRVMGHALFRFAKGARISRRVDHDDPGAKRDMVCLVRNFMISTAAANPLVGQIVLIEIAIFWSILRVWGGAASIQDQLYNAFSETEHRVVRS